MANSNIKLFDENKANMLGDEAYNTNMQRLGGVQAGVASSQLQNKFQYQMSLVAYAIAQMMIANNLNAMDSDAVTTFVSNLSNTVLQKVIDKASTADAISGTNDTKWMTPVLVKAYVTNWASGSSTSWRNMVINGTLRVTGATTLQSSLTVSGKTTIDGAAEFGSTVLLDRDPTANLQAATKAYVDRGVSGVTSKVNGLYKMLKRININKTFQLNVKYNYLGSIDDKLDFEFAQFLVVSVKGNLILSDHISPSLGLYFALIGDTSRVQEDLKILSFVPGGTIGAGKGSHNINSIVTFPIKDFTIKMNNDQRVIGFDNTQYNIILNILDKLEQEITIGQRVTNIEQSNYTFNGYIELGIIQTYGPLR